MKLSISTQLFLRDPIDEEVFKLISSYGFSRCELWAMGRHFNYKDKKVVESVKHWSEKFGLSLDSAHLPLYTEDSSGSKLMKVALGDREWAKKSVDELLFSAEALLRLGVKLFVIHVGGEKEIFIENFEKLYRETDSAFAMENDPMGYPLSTDVFDIVNILRKELKGGEERIGACIDVGHANIWEKPPESVIEKGKGKISATHISDNDGNSDLHLVPGDGVINWEKVISAFKSIEYSGNFTYELAPAENRKEVLDKLKKFSEQFDLI